MIRIFIHELTQLCSCKTLFTKTGDRLHLACGLWCAGTCCRKPKIIDVLPHRGCRASGTSWVYHPQVSARPAPCPDFLPLPMVLHPHSSGHRPFPPSTDPRRMGGRSSVREPSQDGTGSQWHTHLAGCSGPSPAVDLKS